MRDAMHDTFLNELIPVIVPRSGNHLLIIGWCYGLNMIDWSAWDKVSFMPAGKNCDRVTIGFNIVESLPNDTGAILVIGADGCALYKQVGRDLSLPVTIVTRGWKNIADLITERMLVRMAVPIFGRPLLWSRLGFYTWLEHSSPRGRLDHLLLGFQRILIPLFNGRVSWIIAIDRDTSVIGAILKKRSMIDRLWQHTRTKMLIIMGDNKLIKIPLDAAVTGKLDKSYESMRALADRYRHSEAVAYFPRNLEVTEQFDCKVFVEDRIRGISAYQAARTRTQQLQVYTSALKFLECWYAPNTVREKIDDDCFERYWLSPLANLKTYFVETSAPQLWDSLKEAMLRNVHGRIIPLVPVHGDFWLNNVIVDSVTKQVSGVIDWDNAHARGLPLSDFFHLISWRVSKFQVDFSLFQLRRNLRQRDAYIVPLLVQHCKNIGVPAELVGDLYAHYWLVELAKRTDDVASHKRILRSMRIILAYYQSR